MRNYTKALINNIERTYTYAHATNAYGYTGHARTYDPIDFFEHLLKTENPFYVFMKLERHSFRNSKNALDRYEIPYTEEEERKARIYTDVTEEMQMQRSDAISMHVDEEDLKESGVVLYAEPFVLTTKETIYVKESIEKLPRNKLTFNHVQKTPKITLKEQVDALETCLSYQISCLIGGAGTGKSFVTAEIINQLQQNRKQTVVLAPTHKAREALQDKLNEQYIHSKVRTIHSFVHNPVECDAIVIDESGMLSTPLLYKLMQIYNNQQIVFVGDKNQIPPVEYGRPFEKIQELFPVAELTHNHRSESKDIIALGREILGIPQNANMPIENIELVSTTEEAFEKGAQVALTFTNANVAAINEEQRLKDQEETIAEGFSVGDKIIAKTNNSQAGYFNGQLFTLINWNTAGSERGKQIKFSDERDLKYNFDLAYGLTIHKSQGSEWDVVAYQPTNNDTRNLAYVAVTRAKKKLIIISDEIRTSFLPEREWRHL